MKTLILYYSYSGNTKELALKKAAETGADSEEITETNKQGTLAAYTVGCYKAMKGIKTEIQPVKSNPGDYEKIIIMAPVWAANPAPAAYNIFDMLPQGKKVEIIMVSAGGGTKGSKERTISLATARGCEVISYTDINAKRKNGELVIKPISTFPCDNKHTGATSGNA